MKNVIIITNYTIPTFNLAIEQYNMSNWQICNNYINI